MDEARIIEALDDEEQAFSYFSQAPVQRSFVPKNVSPEVAQVLRDVLVNGSIPRDLENKAILQCYQNGWLHSEPLDAGAINIVCVFPTNLHAK